MDAPPLDELSARLGIVLREPELIRQAFVHSSYFNENPTLAAGHNERLEFYGDAVIGVTVSRLLFEQYPDEDEGFLTARRAALVNREALAAMALSI
ncbi:MAG: ribonuclease III domain-containing protein, partial [Candidatus Limnocylindria bacterium]